MLATAIDCRNARGTDVTRDDGYAHVTAAVWTLLKKARVDNDGRGVIGKLWEPSVCFTPFPRRLPGDHPGRVGVGRHIWLLMSRRAE